MYNVTIPAKRIYDEVNNEFVDLKETKLQLEHSLISLKKWESKWHKPFLKQDNKTDEEIIDYVRCMTITANVDPRVYRFLPRDVVNGIVAYIEDPMSAHIMGSGAKTTINRGKVVTNEMIYCAMVNLGIPVEFQKWHLNQLITLINVIGNENQKQAGVKKKMTQEERAAAIAARNAENERRKAMLKSRG